jgi:hypothetical protein
VVPLPDDAGSMDMLAGLASKREVFAGARVALRRERDAIGAAAALGGNDPCAVLESDPAGAAISRPFNSRISIEFSPTLALECGINCSNE